MGYSPSRDTPLWFRIIISFWQLCPHEKSAYLCSYRRFWTFLVGTGWNLWRFPLSFLKPPSFRWKRGSQVFQNICCCRKQSEIQSVLDYFRKIIWRKNTIMVLGLKWKTRIVLKQSTCISKNVEQ